MNLIFVGVQMFVHGALPIIIGIRFNLTLNRTLQYTKMICMKKKLFHKIQTGSRYVLRRFLLINECNHFCTGLLSACLYISVDVHPVIKL